MTWMHTLPLPNLRCCLGRAGYGKEGPPFPDDNNAAENWARWKEI